jgi:hypothetical protein
MDFNPLQRSSEVRKRTVGSAHIVIADCNMYRADGTLPKVGMLYNGLKPVVTKWFEPPALANRIRVELKNSTVILQKVRSSEIILFLLFA